MMIVRACRSTLAAILLTVAAVWGVSSPVAAGGGAKFVVGNTQDGGDVNPGDDVCDADPLVPIRCTLRAAIEEANADPDEDRIAFRIGGPNAKGVKVINVPLSLLPVITEPLVIDGYTQPDSHPNTAANGTNARPRIVLNGPGAEWVVVGLDSRARVVVRGLVVQDFGTAIRTTGAYSVIAGNFIGTNAAGNQARPNDRGIGIDHTDHVRIGGAARADRNLISGNITTQVYFYLCEALRITGNLIGVGANGTGNLGSQYAGIEVDAGPADAVIGVVIGGDTAARANVIAHSENDGILMYNEDQRVRILRNSIFGNGDLAIDLGDDGVSLNDAVPDADTDPNGLQNYPVITSARNVNGHTRIRGVLRSMPNRSYRLELFSNPPGTNEAKAFIGVRNVTTGADGVVAWLFQPALKVGLGRAITATATDLVALQTSEVSAPRTVVRP